jgi:hypothetical protein
VRQGKLEENLQPNTSSSGDFVADKVMAILVFIGAACGLCGGLMLAGFSGFVGAIGAAGAASGGGTDAGAVAGFGALGVVFGIAYIILAIVAVMGAIGMLQTKRKGFTQVMMVMGILALLTLVGLVMWHTGVGGIIGLVIDLALAGYCWGRLNGKIGPAIP